MNETKQLNHNYLTISEVKDYLNISQAKAYTLTHRRDFPVCRIEGCIRVPKSGFLAWVRQQTYWPDNLPPVA